MVPLIVVSIADDNIDDGADDVAENDDNNDIKWFLRYDGVSIDDNNNIKWFLRLWYQCR